jgi:hypothetical protein
MSSCAPSASDYAILGQPVPRRQFGCLARCDGADVDIFPAAPGTLDALCSPR